MSKLTQWLPGMYVMLEDFEDDYDLAVVEDWMRGMDKPHSFVTNKENEDAKTIGIGVVSTYLGYGYQDNVEVPTTRITPAQALEIVRNSKKVK